MELNAKQRYSLAIGFDLWLDQKGVCDWFNGRNMEWPPLKMAIRQVAEEAYKLGFRHGQETVPDTKE